MGKKAILFIVVGVVLGVALAGGGIFFMIQNGAVEEPEEVVEPEFDLKDGQRFTLEKVQIPLLQTGSKTQFLQADFTIVFKTEEALGVAEAMAPDIKDAIYGVFEKKTADELRGNREAMKEPVLNAIKELYNNEEDRENIAAIIISSYIIA